VIGVKLERGRIPADMVGFTGVVILQVGGAD
jgi:hypothetical protein